MLSSRTSWKSHRFYLGAIFLVYSVLGSAQSTSTLQVFDDSMEVEVGVTSGPDALESFSHAMGGPVYWGEIGDKNGLSVREVIALAMRANPNLATYEANRAAAQAELIKALEYPNPDIEFEFGKAEARESDEEGKRPTRSKHEIALSQPIEMPGKRLARRVEAEAGFAVVEGERQEFLTTLRADVIEAYYTVQYHAALEHLYSSQLALATELENVAEQRVELGEASRVELLNFRVEVLKAERDMKASRRRAKAARAALDALTGGCLEAGFRLSDGFRQPPGFDLKSSVQSALACHPRLLRLAAELEQRYASLDRARTEWWPNLNLGARQTREFDTDGAAVTLGVEIPLWSRNEGGIARAAADAQKTYNDIVIAFTELRRDVLVAWQNLELAREQIASYEGGIRGASEEAVALAYEQYRLGAIGLFDVLIARRNLQETQEGSIEALYDASVARARLERARGDAFVPSTSDKRRSSILSVQTHPPAETNRASTAQKP